MELRVKIMYITTASALLLLLIMQSVWLFDQYKYTLSQYEIHAESLIVEAIEKETVIRSEKAKITSTAFRSVLNFTNNYSINKGISTKLDICLLDTSLVKNVNIDGDSIMDLCKNSALGIKHYEFEVTGEMLQSNLYSATSKFLLNNNFPFSTVILDSLLKNVGVNARIEKQSVDSMVWSHTTSSCLSLWNPHMTVLVPYDNLQGELVCVKYEIPHSPIVASMAEFLLLSLLLSILIIYSIFYQIATIRRQQRIDEVRRDFLHTMIHELKRPISTLKMCVSSMRNEKLMSNIEFKEDILRSSHNELDSLTLYFSKLRDITFADDGVVPLNLTTFELLPLLNACVAKVPLLSNKKVFIKIKERGDMVVTADSMHLQNIMHNLIENAIKYSGDTVEIEIDYFTMSDSFVIEVSDNGNGISEEDLPHIFDKFFRGKSVSAETATIGIGLGLSYVKMLVEAHRGSVTITSKLNEGTKIMIQIPQAV